ncbi:MAG: type II toxin-antitoxin system VapC family toxin [Gammaproteobacteria bacterium]
MILADTSVWIDHFRRGNALLGDLLDNGEICCHPFVIGELACSNLNNRTDILLLLEKLPQTGTATDKEVLFYIGEHQLMGRGIGYIDAHLLAASTLSAPTRLWTLDKRLAAVAEELSGL